LAVAVARHLIEDGNVDEAAYYIIQNGGLFDGRLELFAALNETGHRRLQNNDTAGAILAYRGAVTVNPESADTLNNLAFLLVSSSKAEEDTSYALELVERAVELTGRQNASVLDTLALCYSAAGFHDDATAAAEEALALAEESDDQSLIKMAEERIREVGRARARGARSTPDAEAPPE
jgi:tetratricopeptide (TPR) repeat protein